MIKNLLLIVLATFLMSASPTPEPTVEPPGSGQELPTGVQFPDKSECYELWDNNVKVGPVDCDECVTDVGEKRCEYIGGAEEQHKEHRK